MSIKTVLAAASIALLPMTAGAATLLNVEAPVQETGIADGGVYGTTLSVGQVASVDVITAVDGDTDSSLGFTYTPASAITSMSLTLNNFESALYGAITAYLSTDDTISPDDITVPTMSMSFPGGGVFQATGLSAQFGTGLVYVILSWTTEADNSFSYDVAINPAPIPLPAAGFLLLGGLGALGMMGRRKRA